MNPSHPSKEKSSVSRAITLLQKDTQLKNQSRIQLRIAETQEDKDKCLQLVYEEYNRKGYINHQQSSSNIHPTQNFRIMETNQDTQGYSIIIMATIANELIGTITINWDSPIGLPLDIEFPEAKNNLPRGLNKIAEITRLAIKRNTNQSKEIISKLFNYICLDHTKVSHYQYLLIEVNPRHQIFYKRMLCFNVLKKNRLCKRVNNAPAILLGLSFQEGQYYFDNNMTNSELNNTLYPHFQNDEQIINELIQYKNLSTI